MKILVIGDPHGKIDKIKFKEFDIVICTGDFCSEKEIWRIFYKSYKKFLKNPYNMTPWYELVSKKKAREMVTRSLKNGRKILMQLNRLDKPVYVIPGNWDYWYNDDTWDFLNKNHYKSYLIKGLKNIKDIHERVKELKDATLVGYGLVNGPELLKYRHYNNIKESTYKKNAARYKREVVKYSKMFTTAEKAGKPVIFVPHNSPYMTHIDRIRNRQSPMNGRHYGSNLVREMILKYKPILSISGHMHEYYRTDRLGSTVLLAAGESKVSLVEMADRKIKKITLSK